MSNTTKSPTRLDANQVLQHAFLAEDDSLITSSFITGKVGRKITETITTTSIANDTEIFAFTENGLALYTLTVIYTDGTREVLLSVERTA